MEWMPVDGGPVKEDKMDDSCNGPGNTQETLEKIDALIAAMHQRWPEVFHWGLAGHCWGGWVSAAGDGPRDSRND